MKNYDELLNVSWDTYKDKLTLKTSSYEDARVWKFVDGKNKDWNGVFMFVIDKHTSMPFVETWEFSGKTNVNGVAKYLITKSRETVGLPEPISMWGKCMWENGFKETFKLFARKQKNIANVYVFHDSGTPDNIGQIKLLHFGVQLRELFQNQMNAGDNSEYAENYPLFNMLSGAVVNLKRRHDGFFYKYDNTTFMILPPEKRLDKDKLKNCIHNSHDLSEFTDAKNYPTFFENVQKLTDFVLFHTPNRAELTKQTFLTMYLNLVKSQYSAHLNAEELKTIVNQIEQNVKMQSIAHNEHLEVNTKDSGFNATSVDDFVAKQDEPPFDSNSKDEDFDKFLL